MNGNHLAVAAFGADQNAVGGLIALAVAADLNYYSVD